MKHQSSINKVARLLRQHFGDKLDRMLVFGSVARGTDRPDSDIDILVVLNSPEDAIGWQAERHVRELVYPVELEDDVVLDLKVMAKGDLAGLRGHTPFMEQVRAQGVAI